jgi:small acid-soluble spore protein H (minor)
MDINRAQEIFESPKKIEVQYDGIAVWIDSIDEQSKTVRVYPEGSPEDRRTVSVQELNEMNQ